MLVFRNDQGVKYIDERMAMLTQMVFYHELNDKIEELQDYKGCLIVVWKQYPHMTEMETIILAWNFLCEYSTEHHFENKLIHETN
jgi:hypothetical protein